MSATDGIEALNMLRQHKQLPDLILMDMMMPNINGLETTRKIKATERLSPIPIIMVTGNSDKRVVIRCLKSGAVDYVVKPFNREILLDKIQKYIKHTQQVAIAPINNEKSWKNSEILNISKGYAIEKPILEISILSLKPGMVIESIEFNDKPYLRNCIIDQKIINNIKSVKENTGNDPIIKIRGK